MTAPVRFPRAHEGAKKRHELLMKAVRTLGSAARLHIDQGFAFPEEVRALCEMALEYAPHSHEKAHNRALPNHVVAEIRALCHQGASRKAIMRHYGVTSHTVNDIGNGHYYREVPPADWPLPELPSKKRRKGYDQSVRDAVINLVRNGVGVRTAAARVGVPGTTARYWVNQAGATRPEPTHCPNGHPLSGPDADVYVGTVARPGGRRGQRITCRACAREYSRNHPRQRRRKETP